MARSKGTSRVTASGTSPGARAPVADPGLPSLRKRRPVMYWTVVVAALAMILSVVGSFLLALA